jgi:hypothetical protein
MLDDYIKIVGIPHAARDIEAILEQQEGEYSDSRLDAVQFDLSPNLSPTRREALILTPLPL